MITTQIIDDVQLAAAALQEGLLVAFPTETVYGLGADATNPLAVQRLFVAKGRPSDNPLIVHLGHVDRLPHAARFVPDSAKKLLERFSPGPMTVVVEKHPGITDAATAGLNTVGIRIPDHPQATKLLRLASRPIAAPSANLSGRPSCTTWQSVAEDLEGKVDFILKGDISQIGIESTVVDCTREQPVLLRAGAVSLEQIQSVLPNTIRWQDVAPIPGTEVQSTFPSPGLHHAHYRPKAMVHLVNSLNEAFQRSKSDSSSCAYLGLVSTPYESEKFFQENIEMTQGRRFCLMVEFESVQEYARRFYETLREADRREIRHIYLQLAADSALGTALRDRQYRAAGIDPSGL